MKFTEKKHYTFSELAARWKCEHNDLVQAVIDQQLTPSLHIDGRFCRNLFTIDHTVEAGLQVESISQNDCIATSGRTGFHYLIWPRRTGSADCQFFYFSDKATDHEEGDICFALPTPICMADVLGNGVIMSDEVARVEKTNGGSSTITTTNEPRPISTKERKTLLTIIAALAKHGNISIKDYGKSAQFISGLTAEMGASVSKRTIEELLKKIPDALEVRMK